MEAGIDDPKEIALRLNKNPERIMKCLKRLETWGVIKRKNRFISYEKIKKKIKKAKTDEERQRILDSIPAGSFRGMLDRERNMDEKIFGRLGNVVHELGLGHKKTKLIAGMLKSAGIPIKEMNTGFKMKKKGYVYEQIYYAYLLQDEERIKAELLRIKESGQKLESSKPKKTKVKLAYKPV